MEVGGFKSSHLVFNGSPLLNQSYLCISAIQAFLKFAYKLPDVGMEKHANIYTYIHTYIHAFIHKQFLENKFRKPGVGLQLAAGSQMVLKSLKHIFTYVGSQYSTLVALLTTYNQ